jgi:GTP-binding protein LepA
VYHLSLENGETMTIDNPAYYPDPCHVKSAEEPYIKAQIITPERYMGTIMNLCLEKRGVNSRFNYLSKGRLEVIFELPLAEILYDFYDRLKTITQGYASFDYEIIDYRPTRLVKLDILVNAEPVDALSQLVFEDNARARGVHACDRLKDAIPRQQFKVAIQGAIGGKIVSRATLNPFRKDVTAKCYGGDISRKRKLLEKQKSGKKKMKMVGAVAIPQEAFLAVLKSDSKE